MMLRVAGHYGDWLLVADADDDDADGHICSGKRKKRKRYVMTVTLTIIQTSRQSELYRTKATLNR